MHKVSLQGVRYFAHTLLTFFNVFDSGMGNDGLRLALGCSRDGLMERDVRETQMLVSEVTFGDGAFFCFIG